MSGPCDTSATPIQLVIAIFSGLSTLLTVFLAHRRSKADRERKWFYRQMRYRHGIGDADLVGPSRKLDKSE